MKDTSSHRIPMNQLWSKNKLLTGCPIPSSLVCGPLASLVSFFCLVLVNGFEDFGWPASHTYNLVGENSEYSWRLIKMKECIRSIFMVQLHLSENHNFSRHSILFQHPLTSNIFSALHNWTFIITNQENTV